MLRELQQIIALHLSIAGEISGTAGIAVALQPMPGEYGKIQEV